MGFGYVVLRGPCLSGNSSPNQNSGKYGEYQYLGTYFADMSVFEIILMEGLIGETRDCQTSQLNY